MTNIFSYLSAPFSHFDGTFQLLLILMVVIWTSGRLFAKLKLPSVLGEIIAGILIGPSVLGLVHENESIKLFAELGVFFIMFHAGLDTNPKEIVKSSKTSIAIAVSGVLVLFILGTGAVFLFGYSLMTSIFMGTILSVTSFPVIARILKDFHLTNTKFGHTILGATVMDDILVFILVSIVVGIAQQGEFSLLIFLFILGKAVLFFVGTLFLGFKILPYFKIFLNKTGTKGFTFSLIVALIFGLFAEAIGLHIILGAYIAGVFVRQEIDNEKMFAKIEDRYFGIADSFLGPIFFTSIGMIVSFSIFKENPILVFSLIAVVIFGQWLGSGGAAYFFGKFSFRDSSNLALVLSGRGVMEIIIAKIGYDIMIKTPSGTTERLLSSELFSSVVVVAIITTLITSVALKYTLKKEKEG